MYWFTYLHSSNLTFVYHLISAHLHEVHCCQGSSIEIVRTIRVTKCLYIGENNYMHNTFGLQILEVRLV